MAKQQTRSWIGLALALLVVAHTAALAITAAAQPAGTTASTTSNNQAAAASLKCFEAIRVENDEIERPPAVTGHSLIALSHALWMYGGIIHWENGEKVEYGHVLWTYETDDNTWDRTFADKGPAQPLRVNETVDVQYGDSWLVARVVEPKRPDHTVRVVVDVPTKPLDLVVARSKIRYYPPAMNMHVAVGTTTSTGVPVMYIHGGKGQKGRVSSDLWMFVFERAAWVRVLPKTSEPAAREMHAGIVIDRGLFIYGGVRGQTNFEDMWHFSFKDSTWTELQPAPGPRPPPGWGHRLALTTHETRGRQTIWMFGGYNQTTGINELWSLDWATRQWTLHGLNGLAFTRGAESLFDPTSDALDPDRGAAAVETTADEASVAERLTSAEEDDGLPAGWWYRRPSRDMAWPAARKGHSMTLFEGNLIVFGGHGRVDFYDDVWVYRIADGVWIGPIPCASAPPPRNYHATAVLADSLFIFGGNNVQGLLKDFWRLNLKKIASFAQIQ
ncbi:hypothetical protein CAOG_02484 [Capsaspora owczarzaki ATCC 30864]|uniref:Kelch repeat-containing protein n=1 Tax=Capsaspora owczarzaki (strain ATCC 30864) TaxID=595528 RepID=A0A0D2VME7_CAPO3|nr:hypothetical protein CAOG_02484 [Capsaspora owczarzaki ATCC 30864]KJE91332.1 hypothetical protein CAOG_002484 [Capsaspora owczarzaki ATCC 30864]|eukprot:XP_004349234.1 hypothetical protein CAOG_02484 [Capsaspora owczarzaki ATCC 30864]